MAIELSCTSPLLPCNINEPSPSTQCALCSYAGGGAGPSGMRESRRRGSSERGRPGSPRSPSLPSPCLEERSKAAVRGRAGAQGVAGAGGRRWPAVTAVSHDGCQRGLGHPRSPAPPRASRRSQECEGWGCRLQGGRRASPPRSWPSGLNSRRPRLGGAGRRPRVPPDSVMRRSRECGGGQEADGWHWQVRAGAARTALGFPVNYIDLLCRKPWKRRRRGEDGRSFLEQKSQAVQNCGAGFGLWNSGAAQTQPGANPDTAVLKVVSVLLLLGLRLLHCSMESLLFELNSDLLICHLTVLWFWMNMAHCYY